MKPIALSIGSGTCCITIPANLDKSVDEAAVLKEISRAIVPVGKLLLFMILCGDAFTININGSVRPIYD
jgi:hypothetical protein